MEKLYGKQLEIMATKARLLGLDAVHTAASGHIGGSLSAMDILTTLYFNVMHVDPANPQDPDRDRFVLSKGHCTPALYPVLSLRGFFPQDDLKLFRSIKGHYSGHPDMRHVKGVDMSTGSLGLDNLCAVVDVNGLQIDGATKDVMPSEPLDQKFAAFNWNVIHVDGHDYDALIAAFEAAAACKGKPTVLIAKTTKGKGVSYMEGQCGWHGKAPNDEQYAQAKAEVEAKLAELEGK